MKRYCVAAGVLLFSLLLVPVTAVAEPVPVIEVPETILAFGEVMVNTKHEGAFTIRNTGNAPLELRDVRPTCGCTVTEFDKVIPPGGVGRVKTVLDTTGFRGPMSQAILVFTNDPETRQVNLVVTAHVRTYVDVLPRPLMRFNVLQGEPATDRVLLVSEDGSDFRILGVEGADNGLKAAFRELRTEERVPERKGSQWEVSVTVPADASEGILNQRLTVKTNSAKAPEVVVAVSGIVRPVVQVVPGELNFGSVAQGAPVGRNLVLVNNRQGNELQVTGVTVDIPHFSTEVTPLRQGQRLQVAVMLKAGTPKGEYQGVVRLATNDPSRPVIEVPIRAVVR